MTTKMRDVEIGDCFLFGNSLFMKTPFEDANSINLESMLPQKIPEEAEVTAAPCATEASKLLGEMF